MTPGEPIALSFDASTRYGPDEVRSVLLQLSRLDGLLRFDGLPENLYRAADVLADGTGPVRLSAVLAGDSIPADIAVSMLRPGAQSLRLTLGPAPDTVIEVPAEVWMILGELLVAVAHMLGADRARLQQPGPSEATPLIEWIAPTEAWAFVADMPADRHPIPQADGALLLVADQVLPAPTEPVATRFSMPDSDLRAAERRAIERGRLFTRIPEPRLRRQTLRWLGRDYETASDAIVQVLAHGLEDPDWETRVTAMLMVARLGARRLGLAVRRVELPKTGKEGLERFDREILRVLRDAVLAHLAGNQAVRDDETGEKRTALTDRILHFVRREAEDPLDDLHLLLHSLAEPVPACPPESVDVPRALHDGGGRFFLRRSGVEMVWVPPVEHLVGTGAAGAVENMVRRVGSGSGFFAARRPLSARTIRSLHDPDFDHPVDRAEGQVVLASSLEDAEITCEALSRLEGVRLTLPSPTEWEMLARGPDGRRYPWGNGFEPGMPLLPSPWEAERTVGILGQWTSEHLSTGEVVVCGTKNSLRCSDRTVARPGDAFAVRPILQL